MNKKGQALVEFILILPVFILLVFAFIDVGKIILCQNHLENTMNEVVNLVNNEKDLDEIKAFLSEDQYNIIISIEDSEFKKIILKTKIDLITPGMKRILKENISVERSIINE